MDNLGFPILLLASVWGAFSVVLKAIEMLNKQRDTVLGISENHLHINIEQKEIILKNDFRPLVYGVSLFLLVLTIIVTSTPSVVEPITIWARGLCYVVGAFVAFASIAMAFAGHSDIRAMEEHINAEKERPRTTQQSRLTNNPINSIRCANSDAL